MQWKLVLTAMIAASLPGIAHAEGDPAKGEKAFRKCQACHTVEPGQHRVGPSLHNVVGRPVASAEGFDRYSEAMQAKAAEGMVWSEENLDAYLADPKGFIPGNKMIFPGIKKPEERADVIAFLKSKGEGS
jgi:cytochrome c